MQGQETGFLTELVRLFFGVVEDLVTNFHKY